MIYVKTNSGVESLSDIHVRSMISDLFDECKSYYIGEYCVYNDQIYRFIADKSIGVWDDDKATVTTIGTELTGLTSTVAKVLWTNPESILTTFDQQTFNLDLAPYDYIDIISILAGQNGLRFRLVQRIYRYNNGWGSNQLFYSGYPSTDLRQYTASRRVDPSDANIRFYDAYYNGAINNSYLIPMQILGGAR